MITLEWQFVRFVIQSRGDVRWAPRAHADTHLQRAGQRQPPLRGNSYPARNAYSQLANDSRFALSVLFDGAKQMRGVRWFIQQVARFRHFISCVQH